MKKILLAACLGIFGLTSCNETNEDVVNAPDRSGGVEIVASTSQYQDKTVVTLTYSAYKNKQLVSSKVVTDTLPSLGTTVAEGDEDENGNVRKVTIPKQYEFYITVK